MITEYEKTIRTDISFKAIITTPKDFDASRESLPMIIFLHGAGERGDEIERVKLHGIPKYFASNPDYDGLRVITLSPQCPEFTVWNDVSLHLFNFILEVAKEYNVNMSRISITGISMGGFGTWEMLISHPDFFSAAAPICGGGMDWRIPEKLKTPIRAFHGSVDSVVPCVYSEKLCKAVNERGGSAELTIYEGVDHDSWTRTYETTDIISWLASSTK